MRSSPRLALRPQRAAVMAAILLLFAAATPAFPQSNEAAAPACPASPNSNREAEFPAAASIFRYSGLFSPDRALTGAPYSGQMSVKMARTLPNGAHLTQPTRTAPMTYRDSLGRTRRDSFMAPGAPLGQPYGLNTATHISQLAEINDPVAGYLYILDDFHRIAHRIGLCKPSPLPGMTVRTPPPAQATRVQARGGSRMTT